MSTLVDVVNETTALLESNLPASLISFQPDFNKKDVEYPNLPVDRQAGSARPWLRATWNNTGIINSDASGCYTVTQGILDIDVVFPKGKGDIVPLISAQQIATVFETNEYAHLGVESAIVYPLPPEEHWYTVRAQITYHYEGFTDANYSE